MTDQNGALTELDDLGDLDEWFDTVE